MAAVAAVAAVLKRFWFFSTVDYAVAVRRSAASGVQFAMAWL